MFSTEQAYLLMFDSQVISCQVQANVQVSKTLRVPIARYCLRLSGSRVRTIRFLMKS